MTLPQMRRRIALLVGMVLLVLFCVYKVSRPHHSPKSAPPPPVEAVLADPPGIVLHHSNTPGWVHKHRIDAAALDHIHEDDHGWGIEYKGKVYHIGYHYVILTDGTIQPGRPEHCPGAHCPHFNNCIGICLVGAFSTVDPPSWKPRSPTKAQMASLLLLCEKLMSKYHIPPENVRRHRDLHETYCPGGRFPYEKVIHDLRLYADAHPDVRTGARPMVAMLPPKKP